MPGELKQQTITVSTSKFFTNENGNSLIKKFNGAFEHIANLYAFHAVVGYFRASGYYAVRQHLLNVPEVKILVGINVDTISAEAKRRGLLFFGDPERTRDEFVKWMREDIKQASYAKEVEDGIMEFMEDIVDKKIQLRVHKTKKLHAKIYIFLPKTFNEYSGGEVITGSSNLTDAGLGTKDESNYEFNVALRDYDDVLFAENEFKKLWEDGEEILPVDVERIKHKSHLGQLFTPFEIYIKFLIEYFGKGIDYDPDTVGDLPKNFKKLSYQVDAVNQGYQMILDHNGFLLADVVGLGKTVIATLVAKRFLLANGTLSTKILVVYPPPLEKNWKSTFRQFGLDKHTRFVSNGSLHKVLDSNDDDYWPKEDYDLILVDEAHKFRNHKSIMFNNLQTICKSKRSIIGNIYGDRKKVVLISATPLNNRPDDIYYQLQLFQDARKSTLPTTNLQSFFAPLIRKYKEVLAAAKVAGRPDVAALRTIYSDIRNKILEPITVRRTRTDVKNFPAYLKDLQEQNIIFPDIAPPKAIEYELKDGLETLFYQTINYLVNDIGYYRYQAIAYLLPEVQDKYYTQAERVSKTLAQIMMTQLVKRLESSFYAFKKSLDRFRISTERMIQMFEKGKIYVAPGTNVNSLMDQDWTDEEIEERIMELSAEDSKNQIFAPADFKDDFINLLKTDLAHITQLCSDWGGITEDPKLDVFKQILKNELFRKDINKTGKLVIFTESKETARYLTEQLNLPKTLTISAENRKAAFDLIQRNFDANFAKYEDEYDIIISTEVLAEGVNLHRSNIVINYDTPWNATKLMQRIGRVNRIGSVADTIYNYAFYPSRQSDQLINLYTNAYIKLQGFHTAFGEDSRIYTTEEILEQVKLHTQGLGEEEDKRLIYLQFIRDFKEKQDKEFKRIKALPLKARTGRKPGKLHNDIKGGTLVFMKSAYKIEFFKIPARGEIEPLTFIAAAELFEAKVSELSQALPPYHHQQVAKASLQFEQELFSSSTETVSGEAADAKTNSAKKFLRETRADSKDEKFREAAESLIFLLDKGTITNLSNELRKLRLRWDKGEIKAHGAEAYIMQLAAKYVQNNSDMEDADVIDAPTLPIEITQKPDIILSETFI